MSDRLKHEIVGQKVVRGFSTKARGKVLLEFVVAISAMPKPELEVGGFKLLR